jgi:hypothetical protein
VQAVVRRAAAHQSQAAPLPTQSAFVAPQAPPAFVAPPAPSTAQRLQELETLRATGVISDAEYNAKRQQIIAEL